MPRRALVLAFACAIAASGGLLAQQSHIDTVTPLAPELAAYGAFDVGVRTIQATDPNRPDILKTTNGGPPARYDRTLTLEVWYPATLAAGQTPGGEYHTITRDPSIETTLVGRAVRDAAPSASGRPFPLVIISHGYPGNRFLMSHVGENLASKGYVTVSIDHKDSTYDDQQSFASTLYNRAFDQLFVLNAVSRLGAAGSGSFLAGLVDDSRTGLVGYSMGGYGVVNVIGGGYTTAIASSSNAPPNKLLLERGADNPDYRNGRDPRIKAAIAIAPWGMAGGFWDAEGLKGIRTPVLFVAGSVDAVAGYERGTRAIYEASVNADRYLLTYINANHNAGAPIPPPVETYTGAGLQSSAFSHYADAVWDTARMNNILDHFATAYFDLYLKGDAGKQTYLDLGQKGSGGEWKGFRPRSNVGLMLEHLAPAR